MRTNLFDNLRIGGGEFEPLMSHLKTSEDTNQLIYKALNNFVITNLICYITFFFAYARLYILSQDRKKCSHNFLKYILHDSQSLLAEMIGGNGTAIAEIWCQQSC